MADERVRIDEPRADQSRGWEVFVREESGAPLRHVGSVDAPSESLALEQAEQLFGWTAETLWLCPADETRRFESTDRTLAARTGGDA
jgi:rSAM-partnered protein